MENALPGRGLTWLLWQEASVATDWFLERAQTVVRTPSLKMMRAYRPGRDPVKRQRTVTAGRVPVTLPGAAWWRPVTASSRQQRRPEAGRPSQGRAGLGRAVVARTAGCRPQCPATSAGTDGQVTDRPVQPGDRRTSGAASTARSRLNSSHSQAKTAEPAGRPVPPSG